MRKGEETRRRVLDEAETLVLEKGFAATSIDELIAATGLTKSGFFYHFKDKNELARALIERYVEADEKIYDEVFSRARELADDPLQSFLVGLKLLAELMADMPKGHPGCLVAVSCYGERLFDRQVRDLNREAALIWRRRFRAMLGEIAEIYPPREPVDLDDLADFVSAVLEGGIVLSKALQEPSALSRQILTLRGTIRALFAPARHHPPASADG
ncbi:TetR/AcrR family transcriptional regulator [Salinarimonas chemoclinalis]|uniref:TetR/AcrR family transcriptional regulator n=1 Tax=Salinarimonas chemoclinalis TaxID=3241599 RepID=UPI003555C679